MGRYAISARCTDPRTAGQLAVLASLPTVAVTTLLAFDIIPATPASPRDWPPPCSSSFVSAGRVAAAIFDRERLITAG